MYRYFCGRSSSGPLWARAWNRLRGRKAVYVCRKRNGHFVWTVKPPGEKLRDFTFVDRAASTSPYRKDWPVSHQLIAVPTPSCELGHRYEFARWEAGP